MKENKPTLQAGFCSLSVKVGQVWVSLEDFGVKTILLSNKGKLVNANK